MTPDQFSAAMKRKAKAIEAEIRSAENRTAEEAKGLLVQYSGGPYSLRELAKMGHPYARRLNGRRLTMYLDPTIINQQSGRFRRSWGKQLCRWNGKQLVVSVTNSSPEAAFMLGTTKMMPRRIDKRVAEELRQRHFNRLRSALRRGLRS